MPFTMSAFFIGSLCIIGVPPMGGSWSKWYLAMGAIDASQLIFVVVLMISSLLSIAYLMPVVVRAFFFEPSADDDHHGDHHGDHHQPSGEGFLSQIRGANVLRHSAMSNRCWVYRCVSVPPLSTTSLNPSLR